MKQTHVSLLGIAALFFMLSACTSNPSKDPATGHSFSIPDTLYFGDQPIPLSKADSTCLASSGAICEYGLQFAFLGMPLTELHLEEEGVQITDRKYTEGGYEWLGKEITFSDGGKVLLEGEFVDQGDPAKRLPFSTTNRIRVESKQFRTINGISVGSPIADLRSQFPDSAFRVLYIPEYQTVDISLPEISRLHFNVQGTDSLAAQANGNLLPLPIGNLNEDETISAIVIVM